MPCLFGASRGERGRFAALEGHFRATFGDVEVAECDGMSLGAQAHQAVRAVRRTDTAALAAMGEPPLYAALAGEHVLQQLAPNDTLSALVRGNLAVASQNRLFVGTDWLSCFPLYFAVTANGVVFSSHLAPLARTVEATLDPAGVVQFLTVGFCLNGRTPMAGITRLLPGQQLFWDEGTSAHRVADYNELWSGEAEGQVNVERTWNLLCEAIPAGHDDAPGVMLSAGWDSRLLLAAAASQSPKPVVTVSHGQPDQLELVLARRLARSAPSAHYEVSLGRDALGSVAELDDLFARTEALLFPYWRKSAGVLREHGAAFAASGILGEVLGGHYASRGPRFERLVHLMKVRSHRTTTAASAEGFRKLLPKVPKQPLWYLNREFFQDHREVVRQAYKEDIARTIERYQKRGVPAGDRTTEAYVTEHRAIQMVAQQPLASFADLDVLVPFGERRLAREVIQLPMSERIQNALSRRLLERYAPAYLRVPLAATGLPASAPIPVEVIGRAGRYAIEALSSAVVLASRGRVGRRRPFGWMNFDQVLRPTGPIREIIAGIQSPQIDKAGVMTHLDEIDAYRAEIKLAHVFLKLAQLDRLIGQGLQGPR